MPTDNNQVPVTPTDDKLGGQQTDTSTVKTDGVDSDKLAKSEPYKTFASQEEFDRHSAGILGSAKQKAEKELLSLLGLKPDEKDKLAKFKEAYDSTLSESEKQQKELETLSVEVQSMKEAIAEKDAIISALSALTGKQTDDVSKYVKMAKGLVDENTSIDEALKQVLSFAKPEETKVDVPKGKPLNDTTSLATEQNPFKNGNLTEQGRLMSSDREKARELYQIAYGKSPSW